MNIWKIALFYPVFLVCGAGEKESDPPKVTQLWHKQIKVSAEDAKTGFGNSRDFY